MMYLRSPLATMVKPFTLHGKKRREQELGRPSLEKEEALVTLD